MPHPGTLFIVATPIGNLEDVSARALRVLREVAVIAAEDTRRTSQLLARYGITTSTTSLHAHNESDKAEAVLARLQAGDHVALVSDAGTPVVSDPGHVLIRRAIELGVRVEPIPGPSAVLAALMASGLPTESFLFMGFPPTKSSERGEWFSRAKAVGGTVVFYEAPHRIRETLEQWVREVDDSEAAVCRELTKIHEEVIRGRMSSILAGMAEPRGEFTVVAIIGQSTEMDRGSGQPSDATILKEFGDLTQNSELNRRGAISRLARRYRLPAGEVYAAIERAKKVD